ncbi:MAG: hypothetical protein ACTSX0_02560, partial [Promethearchaeota archaeon]
FGVIRELCGGGSLGAVEIYTRVSNKGAGGWKSSTKYSLFRKKRCKWMKGRKIMEMCGSFRGMCVRNTADMPKISKIRATFGGRFAAPKSALREPFANPAAIIRHYGGRVLE